MERVENNTSEVIAAEAAAEVFSRWEIPTVCAPQARTSGRGGARGLPTADGVEELQRQAREEAFDLGRREGLEQGRREIRAQVARVEAIIQSLARPLERMDDRLMEEIAALALAIARHLVRREIKADPGQIMAVVRQAAGALPSSSRRVRLYVSPQDAAIVREHLTALPERDGAWQLIEDPALERGGCRIETEHSRIDASVERRLAAIAAEILGGDREGDGDAV
jgi:flagellar assembly protein FliH